MPELPQWLHGETMLDPAAAAIGRGISFDVVNDLVLVSYYLNQLLPLIVHERGGQRDNFDFSYWFTLAAAHQPMMDIALACGAISMSYTFPPGTSLSKKLQQKALSHHTSAATAIRTAINSGMATGDEDWLLATVESLVIFAHRDHMTLPEYASPHIQALAEIFMCREAKRNAQGSHAQPLDRSSTKTQFERLCYESLVYHGAISVWFDKSMDVLADGHLCDTIHEYFRRFPPPGAPADGQWAILGVPYSLFTVIATVSRLSRSDVLSDSDIDVAKIVVKDLASWKALVDSREEYSVAKLFVYVADALVHHILATQTGPSFAEHSMSLTPRVSQCLDIVKVTNIGRHFSAYHLWPITVLASLVTEDDQRQLMVAVLVVALRNMNSRCVLEQL